MIDKAMLQSVLTAYQQDSHWAAEKYKWEAVKYFQDNWDINAADFAGMLKKSLSKTANLLNSANFYPGGMIEQFAREAPEDVRSMFIALFDEQDDVYGRIAAFKAQANKLLERYGESGHQNAHYQNENTISTYLWLHYPDKYYIYKFSEVKAVAAELKGDYQFKKGAFGENIRHFYKFYDEICAELKQNTELVDFFKNELTDTCYPDPELKTLTIDVGYYISHYWHKQETMDIDDTSTMDEAEWFPLNYDPGLSVDDWVGLLNDEQVFYLASLQIMKRMKDYGGEATCTQLSNKYGEDKNFYNGGSQGIARRVAKKTGCPLPPPNKDERWWPILYVGHAAGKNDEGSYVWKLRDELSAALDRVDLSPVELYALPALEKEYSVESESSVETYTKDDFLREVYMNEDNYNSLVAVLENKKNVILQGAPGVGKTFAAKRLAYSMMGEKDESRIEFVQFHQNYSYEDFVMGYKPIDDGFQLKYGIFYQFCKKAESNPDKDYFFIIDEINRGNMSKIFGELLMLIENDHRGEEVTLAYNGQKFSVPKNLYIIGMMNTADRSLAMIDYALRRRFSFFELEPGFDSDNFIKYQKDLDNELFDRLIGRVKELNDEITRDKSLGKGFCIGHSYFCNRTHENCDEHWMHSVVKYDIIPMLDEYWFDDSKKIEKWESALNGVFQ